MRTRGGGSVLVVLVLLAGMPFSGVTAELGPGAAVAEGGWSLDAESGAAGVVVDVSGGNDADRFATLIGHADRGMFVVDRASRFDAGPGMRAEVRLLDVPPHEDQELLVTDDVNVTRLVEDPERRVPKDVVDALPVRQRVPLPTEPVSEAEVLPSRAAAHFVTRLPAGFADEASVGQVVTTTGVVVVFTSVWDSSGEGNESETSAWLDAFVSVDGGRTFGDPVRVTPEPNGTRDVSWDAAPAPDGGVVVVYSLAKVGQTPSPPRVAWFDPLTGVVTGDRPAATNETFYPSGRGHSFVALDHERLLFVKSDHFKHTVWSVEADGPAERVASFDPGTGSYGYIGQIAVGPGGLVVGVLLVERHPDWSASAWFVVSLDGGRTFGEPVRVEALDGVQTLDPWSLRVDAEGTVHAMLFKPRLGVTEDKVNKGFYARLPADGGPPEARPVVVEADAVAPSSPSLYFPSVQAMHDDVWLFWHSAVEAGNRTDRGPYGVASFDGGATFGQPHYVLVHYAGRDVDPVRMKVMDATGLLPGGRPILLMVVDYVDLVVVPWFEPIPSSEDGLVVIESIEGSLTFAGEADSEGPVGEVDVVTSEAPPSGDPATVEAPAAGFVAALVAVSMAAVIGRRARRNISPPFE